MNTPSATTMPTTLSVSVATVVHRTVTIVVQGRLDAASCPELRGEVDAQLAEGCSAMIVDLQGATFVDSVGLAALVKAMRDAEERSSTFVLVRPASESAMRIFRLSKFDQVFTMRNAR